MHPYIQNLLNCLTLEEKEEQQRFTLNETHTLKQLKAEGLALHPIRVTRKNYGFADYPEISFTINYPPENIFFKVGSTIECFIENEEPVKGLVLELEKKSGVFRIFAPEFPDWIEDKGVGIKISVDTRTIGIMRNALKNLETNSKLFPLFCTWHNELNNKLSKRNITSNTISFFNKNLNASQQQTVAGILANEDVCIVHGPPGTGKSTSIAEAIMQLCHKGEKILFTAPTHTAVDHLCKQLIKKNIKVLRVGNSSKADEEMFTHTIEGMLQKSKVLKEMKELKKRAEEFRRMAKKYKRNFGKDEREQRKLLFAEVKNIQLQIKKLRAYEEEKLMQEAQVVAGTPIGLYDEGVDKKKYSALFIDEAGQCLEPLAWSIFSLADKIILSGDHLQLPATVLSFEAAQKGLSKSILEVAIKHVPALYFLDTQYRMHHTIAAFSNAWFYNNLLQTPSHLQDSNRCITFIDTAGTGFTEQHENEGSSLYNDEEIALAYKIILKEKLALKQTTFISPYAGQTAKAKEFFLPELKISTIDGFQGQEKENIIISLVRSNDEGAIGFLKDYRRMNVALTRAKEKLFIIGDSATLGHDKFYHALLSFIDLNGNYNSAWDYVD